MKRTAMSALLCLSAMLTGCNPEPPDEFAGTTIIEEQAGPVYGQMFYDESEGVIVGAMAETDDERSIFIPVDLCSNDPEHTTKLQCHECVLRTWCDPCAAKPICTPPAQGCECPSEGNCCIDPTPLDENVVICNLALALCAAMDIPPDEDP